MTAQQFAVDAIEELIVEVQMRLREAMRMRNIDQRTLAGVLGLSEGRVSIMLGGRSNLTLDTIARVLHACGARASFHAVPLQLTLPAWLKMTAKDITAIRRFNETTDDGQEYDVPKAQMLRLEELGFVQRVRGRGRRYEPTGLALFLHAVDTTAQAEEAQ